MDECTRYLSHQGTAKIQASLFMPTQQTLQCSFTQSKEAQTKCIPLDQVYTSSFSGLSAWAFSEGICIQAIRTKVLCAGSNIFIEQESSQALSCSPENDC